MCLQLVNIDPRELPQDHLVQLGRVSEVTHLVQEDQERIRGKRVGRVLYNVTLQLVQELNED